MDRRSFLKIGGLVAASGLTGACGQTAQKVIPYVIPPDDGINPVAGWYFATSCRMCGAGCGVMVRTVEGRAKKIEGNPLHPLNQGGTCARGQAALQHLYHPERITQPLKRKGAKGSNAFEPVTWDEAMNLLAEKLKSVKSSGGDGVFAMIDSPTDASAGLARRLLDGFGSKNLVVPNLRGDESYRTASELFGPAPVVPFGDVSTASFVWLLGADIFENGFSPVLYSRIYGEMRRGDPTRRGTLIYAGPRISLTAASADNFVPTRPGELGILALGVAREVLEMAIDDRLLPSVPLTTQAEWSQALIDYTSQRVSERTGVPEETILKIADGFIKFAPALAVAGDDVAAHTNGVNGLRAVEFLNLLSREVGRSRGTLTPKRIPQTNPDLSRRMRDHIGAPVTSTRFDSLVQLARRCSVGEMSVGLLVHTNPVYSTPASLNMGEALARVGFLAVIGHFLNESTQYADLILPDHHSLESWSAQVVEFPEGVPVFNLQQPVVRPLYDTRPAGDILIEVADRAGMGLGFESTEHFIKKMISRFRAEWPEVPPAYNDNEAWEFLLSHGGWWPDMWTESVDLPPTSHQLWELAGTLSVSDPEFSGGADAKFYLHPYETINMGDGQAGNIPWLLEMPETMTTVMWGSWVEINPKTAQGMGIQEGDVLRIESDAGWIEAPAYLYPGVAPDTVAVPFGWGHTAYGKYATGRGANAMALLGGGSVKGSGAVAWRSVRVKVTKTGTRVNVIRAGHPVGQYRGDIFGI